MKRRPGEEGKENWLLIKHRDEYAVDGDGSAVLAEQDRSVASGRTLDEIAAEAEASVWHGDKPPDEQTEVHPGEEFPLDPSTLTNARPVAEMPRFVAPELATLVKKAPEGEEWLHEVKFDGYRALAASRTAASRCTRATTRTGPSHFALIADELARLPVTSAMLDGEVVVQMPDGSTSFQELQSVLGTDRSGRYPRQAKPASDSVGSRTAKPVAGGRLLYYVFDLLYLDGYDLLDTPLEERKELLKRLLSRQPGGPAATRIMYSEHVAGDGPEFLAEACGFGLEGMVSKAAGSRYRAGVRGSEWLKTKCLHEQEFVIGGYTDPAGTRAGSARCCSACTRTAACATSARSAPASTTPLLRSLGGRLRDIEVDEPPVRRRREAGAEGLPLGAAASWSPRWPSRSGRATATSATELQGPPRGQARKRGGRGAAGRRAGGSAGSDGTPGPAAADAAPPPPSVSQPPPKPRRSRPKRGRTGRAASR